MNDDRAVREALNELSSAEYPRICRCMHVIAAGGASLTATDVLRLLEALDANEAQGALTGDDYPDLNPLFRSVPGLDRIWRDAPESRRKPFAVALVKAGILLRGLLPNAGRARHRGLRGPRTADGSARGEPARWRVARRAGRAARRACLHAP